MFIKKLLNLCCSFVFLLKEFDYIKDSYIHTQYLVQKDSTGVKEALDQLSEVGWAKKWSSQPYVSRRTVSLH